MAPLQKAGIVALVKNRTDDMTLAIGDGMKSSIYLFNIVIFLQKNENKIG